MTRCLGKFGVFLTMLATICASSFVQSIDPNTKDSFMSKIEPMVKNGECPSKVIAMEMLGFDGYNYLFRPRSTLRLLGNMFGDTFLKNFKDDQGSSVEGDYLSSTMVFLSGLLHKTNITSGGISSLICRLQIAAVFDIAIQSQTGSGVDVVNAMVEILLKLHVRYPESQLESVLVPAGWMFQEGVHNSTQGHSILMDIRVCSDDDQYDQAEASLQKRLLRVRIFNTGFGIGSYHSFRSHKSSRMNVNPVLEFDGVSLGTLLSNRVVSNLLFISSGLFDSDASGHDAATAIYEIALRPILGYFHTPRETFFAREQLSGTCASKVLKMFMLAELGRNLYQRVRREIEYIALDMYISKLEQDGCVAAADAADVIGPDEALFLDQVLRNGVRRSHCDAQLLGRLMELKKALPSLDDQDLDDGSSAASANNGTSRGRFHRLEQARSYLNKRRYSSALTALKEVDQGSRFTAAEYALLKSISNHDAEVADGFPEAIAIRLMANLLEYTNRNTHLGEEQDDEREPLLTSTSLKQYYQVMNNLPVRFRILAASSSSTAHQSEFLLQMSAEQELVLLTRLLRSSPGDAAEADLLSRVLALTETATDAEEVSMHPTLEIPETSKRRQLSTKQESLQQWEEVISTCFNTSTGFLEAYDRQKTHLQLEERSVWSNWSPFISEREDWCLGLYTLIMLKDTGSAFRDVTEEAKNWFKLHVQWVSHRTSERKNAFNSLFDVFLAAVVRDDELLNDLVAMIVFCIDEMDDQYDHDPDTVDVTCLKQQYDLLEEAFTSGFPMSIDRSFDQRFEQRLEAPGWLLDLIEERMPSTATANSQQLQSGNLHISDAVKSHLSELLDVLLLNEKTAEAREMRMANLMNDRLADIKSILHPADDDQMLQKQYGMYQEALNWEELIPAFAIGSSDLYSALLQPLQLSQEALEDLHSSIFAMLYYHYLMKAVSYSDEAIIALPTLLVWPSLLVFQFKSGIRIAPEQAEKLVSEMQTDDIQLKSLVTLWKASVIPYGEQALSMFVVSDEDLTEFAAELHVHSMRWFGQRSNVVLFSEMEEIEDVSSLQELANALVFIDTTLQFCLRTRQYVIRTPETVTNLEAVKLHIQAFEIMHSDSEDVFELEAQTSPILLVLDRILKLLVL